MINATMFKPGLLSVRFSQQPSGFVLPSAQRTNRIDEYILRPDPFTGGVTDPSTGVQTIIKNPDFDRDARLDYIARVR